ncbi:MAG: hypothetical protein WA294_01950 [Acidobacteriaceae bacterium]
MRKSVLVVLLAIGGVAVTAAAKTKKSPPLSQLFCQARFVYVKTYEGAPDARTAQQYPGDYDAAIGVQQRLQRWNRYSQVIAEQQADLVFVVWKARPEGNRLPGQPTQMPPVSAPQVPDPGTGTQPTPRSPNGAPGQDPGGMGPPDSVGVSNGGPGIAAYPSKDQLAVYQPESDEDLHAPLWKKTETDGLSEPRMTLFGQLAHAVDDACPNTSGNAR